MNTNAQVYLNVPGRFGGSRQVVGIIKIGNIEDTGQHANLQRVLDIQVVALRSDNAHLSVEFSLWERLTDSLGFKSPPSISTRISTKRRTLLRST